MKTASLCLQLRYATGLHELLVGCGRRIFPIVPAAFQFALLCLAHFRGIRLKVGHFVSRVVSKGVACVVLKGACSGAPPAFGNKLMTTAVSASAIVLD